MSDPEIKQRQPASLKRMLYRAKARAAKSLQRQGYEVFRIDHQGFHILAIKADVLGRVENRRVKIVRVDLVDSLSPSLRTIPPLIDNAEIWAIKPGSDKFFIIDVKM